MTTMSRTRGAAELMHASSAWDASFTLTTSVLHFLLERNDSIKVARGISLYQSVSIYFWVSQHFQLMITPIGRGIESRKERK